MIVKIENAFKKYFKENETILALNNVSYSFELNKFYGIMGPSGSGKSTFLQCIGTLDSLTSGKIFINGKDISSLNDNDLSFLRKKEIGFVFQDFYLNQNMKSYENVMLPIILDKGLSYEQKKKRAVKLLENLGLSKRINHYPNELSGGERQRVAIARALINNPKIILCDESTGNLDSKNELKIFELLKKLSNEGKCVIVVTHNDNIRSYTDKIVFIKDGKIYE